jgi:hypothetical protein
LPSKYSDTLACFTGESEKEKTHFNVNDRCQYDKIFFSSTLMMRLNKLCKAIILIFVIKAGVYSNGAPLGSISKMLTPNILASVTLAIKEQLGTHNSANFYFLQ